MVPSLSSTVNYTDTTLEPLVTENSVIRQKIIDSQFKCYERMNRAPPYKKKGKRALKPASLCPVMLAYVARNASS